MARIAKPIIRSQKSDKLRAYLINNKVFNLSFICNETNVRRLHVHRWLSGNFELSSNDVLNISKYLVKYGYKK